MSSYSYLFLVPEFRKNGAYGICEQNTTTLLAQTKTILTKDRGYWDGCGENGASQGT